MTPKEKAKELIDKFLNVSPELKQTAHDGFGAKQCALIVCNEILEIIRYHGTDIGEHSLMFWQEVKEEI